MSRTDVRPSTPESRRFVRYVLGFGVGVAVGLAPYLGLARVPGFSPLLDLFPVNLQDTLIPISAFLMGTMAVVFQFYSRMRTTQKALKKTFRLVLATLGACSLLLLITHFLLVARVPVQGGEQVVSFAIGVQRGEACPCPSSISDSECIQRLTLNPAKVRSCWGDGQVRLVELMLSLSYLGAISLFGGLVGLLIAEERRRDRRPRA